MDKSQLLIAEYTAISEHFRSYQSNRLNIILIAIPAFGAIMLNLYDKTFVVQIFSVIMLYLFLFFLMLIDNVFMKRLRNYTIRLSEIETEFKVNGHANKRLSNLEANKDATTNTIRTIVQALNLFVALYSIMLLYIKFFQESNSNICYGFRVNQLIFLIPIIIGIILFFVIRNVINTKYLPTKTEENYTKSKPEKSEQVDSTDSD